MKPLIISATALALMTAPLAEAGPRGQHQGMTDYARVVDVQPITRQIENRTPHESCWTERVRVERERAPSEQSATGTIVGAIVGGAIGNAVGHKKVNKRIGTAVGAILGASVGNDLSRDRAPAGTDVYYKNERRCSTTYTVDYTTETVGYWVTYK
ncbi:MAG: glycine zipper 2TM domain-containing protein, partial [Gammaproteobacteria bacterium]